MRRLVLFLSTMIYSEASALVANYTISIPHPNSHYAQVTIEIKDLKSDQLSLKMPVWTPGSYMVREFEKNIDRVSATGDKGELKIQKADKNTWTCSIPSGNKTIRVSYPIYCFEQSVRTSHIDSDHAFLLLTSCLMKVEGGAQSGQVTIDAPVQWTSLSTTLSALGDRTFEYANYDELVDSPIEIGTHDEIDFEVAGVPHKAALVGMNNCDKEKFKIDLQKICNTMYNIIGEHPCKAYLFIIHHVEEGGGGLEHANSCVVQMPRFNYSNPDRYKSFLGLCAHEYFHLWNVKRIRPIALGPFDYSKENHTNLLWVAEGITSYYDELALYRAGYVSEPDYLKSVASNLSATLNRNGGKVQSMHEASFDAWIKEYRSTENSTNNNISYYLKGQTLANLLDIEILAATNGAKGLDHLMRHLYKQFYLKQGRGFTDDEFYNAIDEVAGKPLQFRQWAEGLNDESTLNRMTEIFKKAGCTLTDRNKGNTDYLGISTETKGDKLFVRFVEINSPAWNMGLQVGDELIAINNFRVKGGLEEMFKAVSGPYQLLVSRAGILRTIDIELAKNPKHNLQLSIDYSEHPIMLAWLKKQ